jgi:hypothetical protein
MSFGNVFHHRAARTTELRTPPKRARFSIQYPLTHVIKFNEVLN